MKTALCYDYLLTKGGAEKVILELAKIFKADVYTVFYNKEKCYEEFKEFKVRELGGFSKKTPFLQINAIEKFRKLDLSSYDLIISSGNWAKQVAIGNKGKKIIHYEHTPIRFLYDLKEKTRKRMNPIKRPFLEVFSRWVAEKDQEAVQKLENIICNSKNVQKRIEKYYRKKAQVIYPPIDVSKYKKGKSEDYFVSIQRIAPEKRVEIQIKALEGLKEKLYIIGSGDKRYIEKLKTESSENIKFLNLIEEQEKIKLISKCKAVIQTALDEDFGIVPLEAMACGKPCIAVNEGGFKETIINEKTGILIDEPYVKNLKKAIETIDEYSIKESNCIRQAEKFSIINFKKNIKSYVEKIAKQ